MRHLNHLYQLRVWLLLNYSLYGSNNECFFVCVPFCKAAVWGITQFCFAVGVLSVGNHWGIVLET